MLMTFGKANRAILLRELGARLRARRLELGLDQAEVMKRVAASASRNGQQIKPLGRNTLSQYEHGTSMPALDVVIALADALQTTPWWLSFGVEPATSPPPETREASSGAARRSYWEADQAADGIDGPALALIGDQATNSASPGTLYLFDRSALPTTAPGEFIALQGGAVSTVRAIKAGDFTLIDQGGDLWRMNTDQVLLLGRVVERLEGRSF